MNTKAIATCGTCGRSWDDSAITSITPTPSARCPFEYFHEGEDVPEDWEVQPLGHDWINPAEVWPFEPDGLIYCNQCGEYPIWAEPEDDKSECVREQR